MTLIAQHAKNAGTRRGLPPRIHAYEMSSGTALCGKPIRIGPSRFNPTQVTCPTCLSHLAAAQDRP